MLEYSSNDDSLQAPPVTYRRFTYICDVWLTPHHDRHSRMSTFL